MAKKFVLGIDLDEVCARYIDYFRGVTSRELGVSEESLSPPAFYSFKESGWGFDSEDHFREVHGKAVEAGLYEKLVQIEGASETLWRLSDEGYENHVITSRFVNHRQNAMVLEQTAKWLDKENIPYRSISFTSRKELFNADLFIDDSPSNIERLRANGKNVLIFTAPYNVNIPGPRAGNWEEVYTYIKENHPIDF